MHRHMVIKLMLGNFILQNMTIASIMTVAMCATPSQRALCVDVSKVEHFFQTTKHVQVRFICISIISWICFASINQGIIVILIAVTIKEKL